MKPGKLKNRYFINVRDDGSHWVDHKYDYIVLSNNGKIFTFSPEKRKITKGGPTLEMLTTSTEFYKEVTKEELALIV